MISEPSHFDDDDDFIEVPDSTPIPNSEQVRNSKGQFLPGVSGNPTGRPRGIHDRRHIVNDLMEAYRRKGGVDYLESLPPDQFNALFKQLIPKELDVTTNTITSESVAEQVVQMQRRGGRL